MPCHKRNKKNTFPKSCCDLKLHSGWPRWAGWLWWRCTQCTANSRITYKGRHSYFCPWARQHSVNMGHSGLNSNILIFHPFRVSRLDEDKYQRVPGRVRLEGTQRMDVSAQKGSSQSTGDTNVPRWVWNICSEGHSSPSLGSLLREKVLPQIQVFARAQGSAGAVMVHRESAARTFLSSLCFSWCEIFMPSGLGMVFG